MKINFPSCHVKLKLGKIKHLTRRSMKDIFIKDPQNICIDLAGNDLLDVKSY